MSTPKCPTQRATLYASDPVLGEQTTTTKTRLSQETLPRLNPTLLPKWHRRQIEVTSERGRREVNVESNCHPSGGLEEIKVNAGRT